LDTVLKAVKHLDFALGLLVRARVGRIPKGFTARIHA
jgi:hypothetical protein